MIISLFTFGLSWALYAFVFFGITLVLPQFHSNYTQSTFTIAFLIGFMDAALLKAVRVMNFRIPLALLFIVCLLVNFVLILGTSGAADTYYVTGHKGPAIAAFVLAIVMVAFEQIKVKFFS